MKRVMLALLGLAILSGCGPATENNGPVMIPGDGQPPMDVCVAHRATFDDAGDDCSFGGSDVCLPVDCPCAGGVVTSRSCTNGACDGHAGCEAACASAGGYVCAPDAQPTCEDDTQNGDETGVDCGGSCPACAVAPTCDDRTQNGDETGVDCGGSCAACAAPTCDDDVRNGDETGVDCGGSCPACQSGPSCFDDVQNGDEAGVDCGGSCPRACPAPSACPFPDEITTLSNVMAADRVAPSGLRLVVVQGDVAVSQGSAKVQLLMVNPSEVFPAGTYDIESMAKIPGLCETNDCLTMEFTNQGQTFRWSSLPGGTVTIEDVSALGTRGQISGGSFPVDSARLAGPAFELLGECETNIKLSASWDANF